jgi:hypothetical protein
MHRYVQDIWEDDLEPEDPANRDLSNSDSDKEKTYKRDQPQKNVHESSHGTNPQEDAQRMQTSQADAQRMQTSQADAQRMQTSQADAQRTQTSQVEVQAQTISAPSDVQASKRGKFGDFLPLNEYRRKSREERNMVKKLQERGDVDAKVCQCLSVCDFMSVQATKTK